MRGHIGRAENRCQRPQVRMWHFFFLFSSIIIFFKENLMPKSYFNNAIIGNSGMLACITDTGELIRLFWPNIDYPQHFDRLKGGIFIAGDGAGTSWLDSEDWTHSQAYIPDTNILVTECENSRKRLRVSQTDFALPGRDVLVRHYEIENRGENEVEAGFMHFSSGISSSHSLSGVLFDFGLDALVHYRHDYYISIASAAPVWKYQLGGDAFNSAGNAVLKGTDSIGMMQDGAAAWKTGSLAAGGKTSFTLYICAAHSLKVLKELTADMVKCSPRALTEAAAGYWRDFLENAKGINTGIKAVDELYKRSLLVFGLMSDKKTGGLLAAPEIDEEFTRCGRYAYCWGRDAAFITGALDKCGLTGEAERFYRWAAEVQDEEGCWQQRYHMDGNLAPSWGLQIDETGSIIWGVLQHYRAVNDPGFLASMWECVRRGVEFLIKYIDAETGVPWLSFDLWEERLGEHAYSSAAVWAGITAGADIGALLGKPEAMLNRWREAAAAVKSAIERNFWRPEWNRFIRSIRLKLNPWGTEHANDPVWLEIDNKGNWRDFTLEDGTIDISLLGLCIPFGLYAAGDRRMAGTAEAVEKALSVNASVGLMRYENDSYIGGNPWIITTLWAALYNIEHGDLKKAGLYFEWAVSSGTALGLLPEQVDRESGKPAWVIPLTWSHAMFVLTLFRLMEAGVLQDAPVSENG